MNKSNSPQSVVGQRFADAKRQWHDMQKTHLASYAAGFETPALVQPLTGNTTVILDMDHAIQTNPTATPVFDAMRVTVRAFFAPQRIYCRNLLGNNLVELNTIEEIELPTMPYTNPYGDVSYAYESGMSVIPYGSLLHRLGYPASILAFSGPIPLDTRRWSREVPVATSDEDPRKYVSDSWNLTPIAAYFDICARYLSNPYDMEVPMSQWVISDDKLAYNYTGYTNVKDVQTTVADVRGYIVDNELPSANVRRIFSRVTDVSMNVVTSGLSFGDIPLTVVVDDPDVPFTEIAGYFAGQSCQLGLWPALYMQDPTTTYFDTEEIETLMAVETGSDVQSYRLGQSIWARTLRSIMNGKSFEPWIEAHFGVKLKLTDHPIYVGKDVYHITFNDVLNTNGDSTNNEVPLGSAASRGGAGGKTRKQIAFTTQEPGYLIVLLDIVPYVSYTDWLPNWLDWKTYSSFPLPEYAGRTFQDLTVGDVVNTGVPSVNKTVIGKQPLFYDFMINRNSLGGIFSSELLDAYTFKRNFNVSTLTNEQVVSGARSTFIQKGMYDYAFPDWGQNGGENIFIKSQFNMRLLQPIPRDVIKNRI